MRNLRKMVSRGVAPLLVALVCAVNLGAANADERSPYIATVTDARSFNNAIENSLRETSRVTVINPVDQLTITAQVKTLGNITLNFNREWHVPSTGFTDNGFSEQQVDEKERGLHLQGYAIFRAATASGGRKRRKVPVAATVFHITSSHPTIEAEFHADIKGDGGHFYQLKGALKERSVQKILKVRRVSRQAFSGKSCGVQAGNTSSLEVIERKSKISFEPVRTTSLLSFDIATEADYDWYARYGSSSNTKIQTILNKVQTIYEEQLDLTFSLTKQVTVTSSNSRYTSSNVETLLDSFRTYTEAHSQLGSADVHHLFTGKNTYILNSNGTTNDSVIGLAYLGVVCAYPTYAYGLTENLDDALDSVTTAHEIGHNFNAQHDVAGSIMGTELDLNNPPTQFSTTSKSQISSFVSSNSSCLSSSTGSATPTPGGGTSPGSGDTSHVALKASFNSNGLFTLKTTFTEIDPTCTVEVRASTRSGMVYNGSGTLIATIDPNYTTTTFSRVPVKRRGAKKVYFGATKACTSGTTYYSLTKSVNVPAYSSSKATLSGSSWIKLLKAKIQATTPSKS